MPVEISFYSAILLVGTAHGLYLALTLLLAQDGNLRAHHILAALTFIFALDLCSEFLFQTRYVTKAPHLIWIGDPIAFLYGPLALFYVRALTQPNRVRIHFWPHLLPLILAVLFSIPFYILDPASKINLAYQDIDIDIEMTSISAVTIRQNLVALGQILVLSLFVVQVSVYLFLSIRELQRHNKSIKQNFSYTERINLAWLRNLLIFLSALFLLFLLDLFAADSTGLQNTINNVLYLLMVVMFYTLGYFGLRQSIIFTRSRSNAGNAGNHAQAKSPNTIKQADDVKKPKNKKPKNKKYQASALDEEGSRLLLEDLNQHMAAEKPYLNSKLTLPELSIQMGISTNYLSQVINQQRKQNFFDFINHYRIEAAKRDLSDFNQAKINVLKIAFDAGFNSKSAFYAAFRKRTGMTPHQYRNGLPR